MVFLIFREEWFDADKEVLIFVKIIRLVITAVESCVKSLLIIAEIWASESCFFVHHIKIGTRNVVPRSVADRFDLLRFHTSSFKFLICLKIWFLTILQLKLEQVFKVVNSNNRVIDTWDFREKVFFRIIWRQLVTYEWSEFYWGIKLKLLIYRAVKILFNTFKQLFGDLLVSEQLVRLKGNRFQHLLFSGIKIGLKRAIIVW